MKISFKLIRITCSIVKKARVKGNLGGQTKKIGLEYIYIYSVFLADRPRNRIELSIGVRDILRVLPVLQLLSLSFFFLSLSLRRRKTQQGEHRGFGLLTPRSVDPWEKWLWTTSCLFFIFTPRSLYRELERASFL